MTEYCSLDEALSLLGNVTLHATSEPSLTQGQALLVAVVAEVDMHLRGCGYVTPVTDADALASLKTICMNGVASKIAKAKWPTAAGPGGDGGIAVMLRDDYRAGLKFIDDGGLSGDVTEEVTTASFNYGFPSAEELADQDAPF